LPPPVIRSGDLPWQISGLFPELDKGRFCPYLRKNGAPDVLGKRAAAPL
jgi:hypothetical protein